MPNINQELLLETFLNLQFAKVCWRFEHLDEAQGREALQHDYLLNILDVVIGLSHEQRGERVRLPIDVSLIRLASITWPLEH